MSVKGLDRCLEPEIETNIAPKNEALVRIASALQDGSTAELDTPEQRISTTVRLDRPSSGSETALIQCCDDRCNVCSLCLR